MDGGTSTSFIVATLLLIAGWITFYRFLRNRKSRELDRKYGRRAITFKIFLYLSLVMITIFYMRAFIL